MIKEDLIKFTDYLKVIKILFNITKIKFKNIKSNNIDFSPILNEDLNLINYSIQHTIEGYLSYKFIKNLKNKNIKVDLFINWWENQTIDKAYNFHYLNFSKNQINWLYRICTKKL